MPGSLKNYVVATIIFTFMVVGGVSIVGLFGFSNPDFANDPSYVKFNQSFNNYNKVVTNIGSLNSAVQGTSPDQSVWGIFETLLNSAWGGLKLIGNSFGFMSDSLLGVNGLFGVPSWIITLATLLITVSLIFGLYYIITKVEP